MKEALILWTLNRVVLPFAFWLDDVNHTVAHRVLKESEEAKREKISLHEYRKRVTAMRLRNMG